MSYQSRNILFRSLGDAEEAEFAEWAQTNPPERAESWHVYHPVCRRVWIARGIDLCSDAECAECGRDLCPHADPLHFAHDGCPSCSRE